MKPLDHVIEAASFGARRTRESLGRALLELQDSPQGQPLNWLALGIAQTVGRLFAIELGSEPRVRACLGDAVERLRGLLTHLQQMKGSNPAAEAAMAEIAGALTTLHPLHAALEKAHRGKKVLVLVPDVDDEGNAVRGDVVSEPPPPAEAETERRDGRRKQLDVEVGLNTETNFYEGRAGDVSRGGIFIVTEKPLPVGEEVQLSMLLPTGRQITLPGRVQWVRAGGRVSGKPPGMGIRFQEMSDQELQWIRAFVALRKPMKR